MMRTEVLIEKWSHRAAHEPKSPTPTFLLELPLLVNEGQARRMRAHLEAGRALYNALLSEGNQRLRQMRADPAWQAACAIPRSRKQERAAAFKRLRQQYGFSEYGLHEAAKALRTSWLAEHLDAVLAQTLATRAYRALNRVCLGQARRVRFRSRSRGLASLENKRNDTGLRFVLQRPEQGNQGYVIWNGDQLLALIDWKDPVVQHGLRQRIKYCRLVQRKVSSPKAQGADQLGYRYFIQLVLEGVAYQKPKHTVGKDIIGADLGPSTIALVPRQAEASLAVFCQELAPDEQALRRLQRKFDRQRRAAIPTTTITKDASRNRASRSWYGKRAATTRKRGARRPRKNAARRSPQESAWTQGS